MVPLKGWVCVVYRVPWFSDAADAEEMKSTEVQSNCGPSLLGNYKLLIQQDGTDTLCSQAFLLISVKTHLLCLQSIQNST